MKYFKDVKNVEQLRKQYLELLKKFHPDNGGSEEATKEINAEYEKMFARLKNIHGTANTEEKESESESFDAEMDAALREAIEKIVHLDGINIEICGSWVWVSGNTFNCKSDLKEAGFSWASKKKMWFFHAGEWKKHNKGGEKTMETIRSIYGSKEIKTQPALRLAV